MQQQTTPSSPDVAPPATPAPPPPPAQPSGQGTGRVTVTLPDGPLPLDGLPKNVQELQGLRERREILRDQLERAQNRRGQLVGSLENLDRQGVGPDAKAGVQQRLDLLDARILQLERDQIMTERLISNTSAAVLGEERTEQQQRGSQVDEDDAVAGAFAAFGGGILLTLIVSRIRRALARRRGGRSGVVPGAPAGASDDPRIAHLAQAVDAIAEEVERIGEGQRFVTQLLSTRPTEAQPVLRHSEVERR